MGRFAVRPELVEGRTAKWGGSPFDKLRVNGMWLGDIWIQMN
jgi:hypothetical protein